MYDVVANVCAHVFCISVCIQVYIGMNVYGYECMCVYVHMSICVHICAHVCMHVYMCVCMCMCVSVCVCVCM